MHAIYNMVGTDPDPVNAGDTKSWFLFYKWGKSVGETYIPLDAPVEEVPGVGDTLWFVLDNQILGYTTVISVSTTLSTGKTEVWYDADDAVIVDAPGRSYPDKYWRQEEPLVRDISFNVEQKEPLDY